VGNHSAPNRTKISNYLKGFKMTTPDVDLFADMTSEATDSTETNTSDAATTAEM